MFVRLGVEVVDMRGFKDLDGSVDEVVEDSVEGLGVEEVVVLCWESGEDG